MKKLSIFALVAVALAACSGEKAPTPEDFATIETELQNITSSGGILSIAAVGPAGDYIIPLAQNDTILDVASRKKTVTFLSIDNPAQYVSEGQCLLNVIPNNTMEAMGTPENKCNFRLFCGSAEDMNETVYAVELCAE